jgi:Peptidase inhibitor I78 family
MMMHKLFPVLVLTLAACAPRQDPRYLGPPEQAPGVDACGAAELADMVGQPKTILQTMRFAVPVRVIEPGTAVTADFQANRLNFEIAEDGTIAKIACY